MNARGGLARNALANYAAAFAGALTGFVVTPILCAHLGNDRFGVWSLLVALMAYVVLLEAGLYATVARRVAECLAQDDRIRLRRVLGTAGALYSLLAVLGFVVVGIVAVFLDHLLHIPPAYREAARLCLLVLGLNQALLLVFLAQNAVLFGAGRLDLQANAATATNLLTACLNALLVLRGYGIVALAVNTTVWTIAGGLILRWLRRTRLPELTFPLREADAQMARELLRFGSRNALTALAGTIAYRSDTLVLGLMLPIGTVAHYVIASKIVTFINLIATRPVDVLLPAYSDAQARGDKTRKFTLFTESVTIALVVSLPLVVAVGVFGQRLILAWVGPGHAASYPLAVALSFVLLLQLPGYACYTLLTGTERNALLVRVYLVGAIVNLLLSFALTYRFGAIGVALGSLITVIVIESGFLPFYVCREFGFRYGEFVARSLRPLLLPLLTTFAVAEALSLLPPGRLLTAAMLALTAGAGWGTWLLTGLSPTRRENYLRALPGLSGRIRR